MSKKKDITQFLSDYTDQQLRDFLTEQEEKVRRAETQRRDAVEKIDHINFRINEVIEELNRRALPQEPPVGSVIRFRRNLGSGLNQPYTYAAIHADNGVWYDTAHYSSKSWKQLVEFIRSDDLRNASHTIEVYPQSIQPYTITLDPVSKA